MVALTKCAFNDDLPGLMFEKRFKNVSHPFYPAVYAHAAKVDRRLADTMDCCIITGARCESVEAKERQHHTPPTWSF